jgi:hypothetical protein
MTAMIETLFAFDERNYQECQNAFRGENNQEYYLGDYTIDAGSAIGVRADKIHLPVVELKNTVKNMNEYAKTGVDPEFKRVNNSYYKMFGDAKSLLGPN